MSLLATHRSAVSNYQEYTAEIFEWYLGGLFKNLSHPNMLWYNGSAYAVGYEENTNLNQVIIVKQTGYLLEFTKVGSGTDGIEPLNHPAPALIINAGDIYVIQNESHVDRFEVWKSDSTEDISSFTSTGYFDTDGAYLGLMKQDGADCTFVTRPGDGGSFIYDQAILEVDLDSPSGYTDTQVTDADYGTESVRHYPLMPKLYGTQTEYIGGINCRNDAGGNIIYKTVLWVTSDFDTYENIGQTFSKNVVSASPITFAELETNYTVVGTDSARTTETSWADLIQIDDDGYLAYRSADDTFTINKYTIGTATAVATFEIPESISDSTGNVHMWYNGSDIVVKIVNADSETVVYTISTSLTNWTFKRSINTPIGHYFGIPTNLDEVDGKYLGIGSAEVGNNGIVPYSIINTTWN